MTIPFYNLSPLSYVAGAVAEERLQKYLFQNYNKHIRPSKVVSDVVEVNFILTLLQLIRYWLTRFWILLFNIIWYLVLWFSITRTCISESWVFFWCKLPLQWDYLFLITVFPNIHTGLRIDLLIIPRCKQLLIILLINQWRLLYSWFFQCCWKIGRNDNITIHNLAMERFTINMESGGIWRNQDRSCSVENNMETRYSVEE